MSTTLICCFLSSINPLLVNETCWSRTSTEHLHLYLPQSDGRRSRVMKGCIISSVTDVMNSLKLKIKSKDKVKHEVLYASGSQIPQSCINTWCLPASKDPTSFFSFRSPTTVPRRFSSIGSLPTVNTHTAAGGVSSILPTILINCTFKTDGNFNAGSNFIQK